MPSKRTMDHHPSPPATSQPTVPQREAPGAYPTATGFTAVNHPPRMSPVQPKMSPISIAAILPIGNRMFEQHSPPPSPATSFSPTTGANPPYCSPYFPKLQDVAPVMFNGPLPTIAQAFENATEAPRQAQSFASMNGHWTGIHLGPIQGHKDLRPGPPFMQGQNFHEERGGLHQVNHLPGYHNPQLGMGSGAAPRSYYNYQPPMAFNNTIHRPALHPTQRDTESAKQIFIASNPPGKQWVSSTNPEYQMYLDAQKRKPSTNKQSDEYVSHPNLLVSQQLQSVSGPSLNYQIVQNRKGGQGAQGSRKSDFPVTAAAKTSNSNANQPRQESSQEDLQALIQDAAKEAFAKVEAHKKPLRKSGTNRETGRLPTPRKSDTPLSEDNDICPNSDLSVSSPQHNSPKSQESQTNEPGHASGSSNSETAPIKCRRGRPTKEEQLKRDRENPEAALHREQAKAAKKAAKQAAKGTAKGMKGKQEVQSIPQGSSTIKMEEDQEAEDLYLAKSEGPKDTARKSSKTITIDQDLGAGEDNRCSASEAPQPATTKPSAQVGTKSPKKRPPSATLQPVSKRRKPLTHHKNSQDKSRKPKAFNSTIDLESGVSCDVLGLGGNELNIAGDMNRVPSKPSTIEALFGDEYCQEHEILEIKENRVYYTPSQVRHVPTPITHFLSSSSNSKQRRTARPAQHHLSVTPNVFGSLSNEEFLKLFNFMKQSLRGNSILLIAPSDGNDSDMKIIEGLVVLVCTMLDTDGVRRSPTSTASAIACIGRYFSSGFSETYTELLDDFDLFTRYGRGSEHWAVLSQQWKNFLDDVGQINKRRNVGPNMRYIKVKEFGYTLTKVPREEATMPLAVPWPFNRETVVACVDKWWKAKRAEDALTVDHIFNGTSRALPIVIKPNRERWPGERDQTQIEDEQEALEDHENMDYTIDWAMDHKEAEFGTWLLEEERSWTMSTSAIEVD
ncbi:hypothetical protein BKA65DRAFT_556424 [Rhexocercosporidium sp. MPI-PUGE-AT-0058]|nr:hypothetical protein BKA65DRAFT_556424 [Rhexocercosporidium sp. MPI-PUGE-AT-0058]